MAKPALSFTAPWFYFFPRDCLHGLLPGMFLLSNLVLFFLPLPFSCHPFPFISTPFIPPFFYPHLPSRLLFPSLSLSFPSLPFLISPLPSRSHPLSLPFLCRSLTDEAEIWN